MSEIDDKLNEVLNIVPEILDVAVVEEQTDLIVPEDKTLKSTLTRVVKTSIRCLKKAMMQ